MDNKYFSVEEMNSLIENLELAFTDYGDKADTLISKCKEFQNDDSYTGERATVVKDLVGDNEVSLVNAQKDMQAKLLSMYKHAADSFAEKVDSAPNARLDLETLDMVESDLKAIYRDVDTTCAEIENIAKEMNAKYGHFGHITVPNADPLRESLENLCGGYNPEAGFYHDLKQKFINWDEEECAYIESQLLSDEIERANSSVIQANTTLDGVLNSSARADDNLFDKKMYLLNNHPKILFDDGDDNTRFSNKGDDDIVLYIKKISGFTDEEINLLNENNKDLLYSLYLTSKFAPSEADRLMVEAKLVLKGISNNYIKKYNKLTENQKKYVDNIDKLDVPGDRKIAMRYVAIELLGYNMEKEFVTGILANINSEGNPGGFESSNFETFPERKGTYLRALDDHFSYREKMSGKSISEVGIIATQEYINNANKFDYKYEYYNYNTKKMENVDIRFGIGMIQWTDDLRVRSLLEYYKDSSDDDNPSVEQCMEIETSYIAMELTDEELNRKNKTEYYKIYDDWKKGEMSAYSAGYIISYKYVVPVDYDTTESDARGKKAETFFTELN